MVQGVAPIPEGDRVPRVGPTLEPRHDVESVAEQIDDLALSFIAPLGTHYGNVGHVVTARPWMVQVAVR